MFNYMVDELDALLDRLKREGVKIDDKRMNPTAVSPGFMIRMATRSNSGNLLQNPDTFCFIDFNRRRFSPKDNGSLFQVVLTDDRRLSFLRLGYYSNGDSMASKMTFQKFIGVLLLQAMAIAGPTMQTEPSIEAARQLYLAGNLKNAAAMVATVSVLHPKLEEAHLLLIKISIAADDVAGALQASRQALREFPDSIRAQVALGDVQFRMSNFTQAAAIYKQAFQRDPKNARANFGLGRVNQIASMNKTARDYYFKAYELDPKDPEIALARARALPVPREIADALEQYLMLPDYRTPISIDDLRQELTENRYFDQRRKCRISSIPAATTLPMQETSTTGIEAMILPTLTLLATPASINNSKPHRFALSTTGSAIVVGKEYASELKLPRIVSVRSGAFVSHRAFAEKIRIGNVELSQCAVTVLSGSIPGADGEIDLSLLRDFQITFDVAKHSIRLEPHSAVTAGLDPDFQDASIGNNKGDFIQVFNTGSTLLIPTRVNDGMETLFKIFLSSAVSSISPIYSKTAGNGANNANLHFDFSTCNRNCAVLNFGNFSLRAAAATLSDSTHNSPLGAVEIGGVLGYNAVKGVPLTIDYRNGFIKFR